MSISDPTAHTPMATNRGEVGRLAGLNTATPPHLSSNSRNQRRSNLDQSNSNFNNMDIHLQNGHLLEIDFPTSLLTPPPLVLVVVVVVASHPSLRRGVSQLTNPPHNPTYLQLYQTSRTQTFTTDLRIFGISIFRNKNSSLETLIWDPLSNTPMATGSASQAAHRPSSIPCSTLQTSRNKTLNQIKCNLNAFETLKPRILQLCVTDLTPERAAPPPPPVHTPLAGWWVGWRCSSSSTTTPTD